MLWIIYIIAGLGAGIITGLAGLSAAVIITPLLVSLCGWVSYDAVTVALASDVLASLLTSYTYYKNKNIDIRRGLLVGFTALLGTIIGSWCGYLFSQAQPDGLGYISILTTLGLGIKFLVQPMNGGRDASDFDAQSGLKKKTALAMLCGLGIGWVCGFTGSGGGVLMLAVFTMLLGYNLKVAVGTATLIMTSVAFVGTVSHLSLGARLYPLSMAVVVLSCLFGAMVSARFANRCDLKRLNRIIGWVLLILGVFTMAVKFFA